MITNQELAGRWREIKGGLREKWGQIKDDEFDKVGGNAEQLVGMLERKTGEARKSIESFLETLVGKGQSLAQGATEAARDYAQQAGDTIRKGYEQVAGNVREGVDQAQDLVKRRPVESIAIALGAGLLVGAILGMMIGRSK